MDSCTAIDAPWPIDDSVRKSIISTVASHGVKIITNEQSVQHYRANEFLSSRKAPVRNAITYAMGKELLAKCSDPLNAAKEGVESGSLACMVHYLKEIDLDPMRKLEACMAISSWDVQKAVLNEIKLPSALYRHLSPGRRAEMLESALGL